MKRFKILTTIFCLSLMALIFSPSVRADEWNKRTVVTFSQAVEIPGGITLPAGTYVFELVDSISDRHIVRISNKDRTHVYATILAIPNWRLKTTDKTVMTFRERAVGSPEAIRSWFYPGANSGEEFVYPKKRALELARITNLPVFAMPTEMEENITKPSKSVNDEPVIALKQTPITAVKPTGEEVDVAEVITPAPAQNTTESNTVSADQSNDTDRLPQTAGTLPLLGLIGLLSLGIGLAVWFIPKRIV